MNLTSYKLGIGPNGSIYTKSNVLKKISELIIGDEVQTLAGFSNITNIIKIINNENNEICYLNGSIFSQYNPVKFKGIWCLPRSITLPIPNDIDLYILELSSYNINEENNSIIVDGIICSTYGFDPIISIPEKLPFEIMYREYC
jgi:hypothetical protein